MKTIYVILSVALCCLNSLNAQDSIQKNKIFRTWVYLDEDPFKIIGVLYEIKDSSILISNSLFKQDYLTYNFKVSSINYNNIDLVKTRRLNSVKKRALIGSATGFIFGAIGSILYSGQGKFAVAGGLVIASFGAGAGSLIGLPKDRIPIKGSLENLNLYRSKLQYYSYIQEYPTSTTFFEHKGFIEIQYGPSFPLGNFADNSTNNESDNYSKTGIGRNLAIGYRVTKNYGISFSGFFNQFPDNKYGGYLGLVGFMAEPIFSIPIINKLFFDLKPGIGYYRTYSIANNTEEKTRNGLGISFSASLIHNYSPRWDFLIETGYFSTYQKFKDNGNRKFQVFNLDFGIAYRFGKKSI